MKSSFSIYIYTPSLWSKNQIKKSNLVFSRADEVPVIGTKNVSSKAKQILMLKKDYLYSTG